jgi:hypothetical protein
MPGTTATPTLLVDAGYLFWAPLLTALPATVGGTVAGSVFTDSWPVAWISLGATEEGSTFEYEVNVEPMSVAEFFDPVRYATTSRTGSFAFSLASYTLTNLGRALNGAPTVISGSGATQLNRLRPPAVGAETRCMIGWESADNTMRLVCYQTICSGTVSSQFRKAPDKALIPCTFNFEMPASGIPYDFFSAGTGRA